jgi:hypothetical protein
VQHQHADGEELVHHHAWNGNTVQVWGYVVDSISTFEPKWLVRMLRELHEVGVLQLAVPAEVVDDLHLPHGPRRRRPGRVRRPAPLRARFHPAAAHPPPFP